MYTIKPIVCDYAVIYEDGSIVHICNIKRNAELIADILNSDRENFAELIADILNADTDRSCAYAYDVYPNAKYKDKVVKIESECEDD